MTNLPTNPLQWALRAILRTGDWRGRAPRAEYWWFALAWLLILGAGLLLLGGEPPKPTGDRIADRAAITGWMFFNVGALPAWLLVPTQTAVSVRRLHDTGRSGWWLLLTLLPYAGGLLGLWWLTRPGSLGANRFGPDPFGEVTGRPMIPTRPDLPTRPDRPAR